MCASPSIYGCNALVLVIHEINWSLQCFSLNKLKTLNHTCVPKTIIMHVLEPVFTLKSKVSLSQLFLIWVINKQSIWIFGFSVGSVCYWYYKKFTRSHLPNVPDWELADLIVFCFKMILCFMVNKLSFPLSILLSYELKIFKFDCLFLSRFEPNKHWFRVGSFH